MQVLTDQEISIVQGALTGGQVAYLITVGAGYVGEAAINLTLNKFGIMSDGFVVKHVALPVGRLIATYMGMETSNFVLGEEYVEDK